MGSGCKLRGIQRGTATDREEAGKSGNRTVQKTGEEKGGAGASLKSNIKRRILCEEGAMSEVGIPPTYNLDNPHALVDSIIINNNNNNTNHKIGNQILILLALHQFGFQLR